MSFVSQKSYLFGTANNFLHDRKFDTALRASTIAKFIKEKDNPSFSDRLIWYHHPDAARYIRDTSLLPRLIRDALTGSISSRSQEKIHHQRLFTILESVLQLQLSFIKDSTSLTNLTHINRNWNKIVKEVSHRPVITRLLQIVADLDEVIERLPDINAYYPEDITEEDRMSRKTSVNRAAVKSLDIDISWSYTMCTIKYGSDTWLLPRPFILQIKAKMADLLSVLLYASMSSHGPSDSNSYDLTINFIIEYCRLHVRRPDKFFTLAASLEGLMVALILKKTETWLNDDLWETLCSEVNDALGISLEHEPIYHIIKTCSVPQLAEIGCLSKITGHPLVDMVEGAKKLYGRVQKDFNVSIDAIANCINYIKENYVMNFISRYNRWPNVTFTELVHPLLKAAHLNNASPKSEALISQYGNITHQDWSSVEIQKELTFNKCENVLGLLADKAISVCRSETLNTYLKEKRPSRKDTRLLLFYLFSEKKAGDHIEYLDKYANSEGDLEMLLDYLVIRVVPKEKELKTLFRGFGCKTYQDRLRGIIQGKNTMTYLQMFSDEQALSLDELSLTRKIYSFLRMKEMYSDHRVFYINFDASGWNNLFRHRTVGPVVRETIDKVFGVKIWEWTHKAYENTLIIIPDDDQVIWWEGQKGGIEGLNQPTWQLVYSGQMKTAFDKSDYPYHLMAKGDDMRAAVPIPVTVISPRDVGYVAKELRDKVCTAAKDFGHEIKPQESYVSERLFTFSKSMYLDGVPLPYVYRKIQKTHGETNSFMPFLDDYVASAFSNAHSACSSSTTHIPQFIVAIFWTLSFLLRHPVYRSLSNDQLGSICCTPSVVGGLPIIYLHNFFIRAESDLLSSFVALYKFAERKNHPYHQILRHFLEIPTDHKACKSMLLSDPYCLPLYKPKSPIMKLKLLVKRKLIHANIRTEVKELLTLLEPRYVKELITVLESGGSWWAKLYSALYDSTPMAMADKFLAQFLSAKSVLDTFLVTRTSRRRSEKLISDCAKQDVVLNTWRSLVAKGISSVEKRDDILQKSCPTEIAQELRNTMWKTEVLTVTHPSLPHQIIVTDEMYYLKRASSLSEHFLLTFDEHPTDPLELGNWHYKKGKYEPFLGSRTSPGTLVPTVKVMENDPICNSILNLVMLYNYTSCAAIIENDLQSSNFPLLIQKILATQTKLTTNDLSPFTAVKRSGTQTHRLRARGFRSSIVPNGNSIPYTRFQGETNTHRLFRESADDYTVNFLHILCYGIVTSQLDTQCQKTTEVPSKVWLVTNDCEYCMKPIKEPIIMLNESSILSYTPPVISITRVGESAEPILMRALSDFRNSHPSPSNTEHDYSDIIQSQFALAWYWISSVWNQDKAISTRYSMHRGTSRQIDIASDLFGKRPSLQIGETEIRVLPAATIFEVLSYHVASYMMSVRHCMTVDEVDISMSSLHVEGCPWYPILTKLASYGLINSLLITAQDYNNDTAPLRASHDIATCLKYVTPIMFSFVVSKLELGNDINVPFFNEKSSEYHYNMCKPLTVLAKYTAAKYLHEQLQSEENLENFSSYYFSIVCPPVDLGTFMNQIDHGDQILELVSRSGLNVQTDMLAIVTPNHPSYYMLQWACQSPDVNFIDFLTNLVPEQIEELIDDMDTRILLVKAASVSLASCIDHVRSQRHGAEDHDETLTSLRADTLPLSPTLRFTPSYFSKLNRIDNYNALRPNPGSNARPSTLLSTPHQFLYHQIGAEQMTSSVIAQLISVLGIPLSHLQTVKSCLILNDYMYSATCTATHVCPQANIAVHTVQDSPTHVPRIASTRVMHPEFPESYLHMATLRAGLTNLRSVVTWSSLMEELPAYPNLVIALYNPKLTMDQILEEYFMIIKFLNCRDKVNTLCIIEFNVQFLRQMGGILTALQYSCLSVHLIWMPTDIFQRRVWIVAYGLYHDDIKSITNFSLTPSPLTAQEISNFLGKWNEQRERWHGITTETLNVTRIIHDRLKHLFPSLPVLIKPLISRKMDISSLRFPSDEQPEKLITSLKFMMAQEKIAKRASFLSSRPEGMAGIPADRTLRHKVAVLIRLWKVSFFHFQLENIDLRAFSLMEALARLPSYNQFVSEMMEDTIYSTWVSPDGLRIKKGAYDEDISVKVRDTILQCTYLLYGYLFLYKQIHINV